MSYYQKKKQPFKKQNKPHDDAVHGVQYHKQFPKDFLRAYGKAVLDTTATDMDLQHKLKDFTCEWLNRPAVAISECLQTLETNAYAIPKLKKLFDKPELMTQYKNHVQDVIQGTCSSH